MRVNASDRVRGMSWVGDRVRFGIGFRVTSSRFRVRLRGDT